MINITHHQRNANQSYNEIPPHTRQDGHHRCTGMTQREDMGREVREGVQDWQLMYTRGGFMSIHGKTNTALLSKIKKNNNKKSTNNKC